MPYRLSLHTVHFVSLCICVPIRLVLFFLSFVENIHGCKTISTYTMHNYTMTLCCTTVAFLLCKSNCLFYFSGSHDCTSVFPHRKSLFILVLFYNQVSICTLSVKEKTFPCQKSESIFFFFMRFTLFGVFLWRHAFVHT